METSELSAPSSASTSNSNNTPLFAIPAGLVGALIGAVVWGALAYYTDREYGMVAWGIGVLTGFLVGTVAKQTSFFAQGWAVLCSLVGIAVGKYLVFWVIVSEMMKEESGLAELPLFSQELFADFIEVLPETLSFYDALWAGLAIVSAYQLTRAKE